MIVKLTKKHEEQIPNYIDKWIKMASGETDLVESQKYVNKIYASMGKKEPIFFCLDSPLSACLAVAIVRQLDSPLDRQLHRQIRSQLFSPLFSPLHSKLFSPLDSKLHSQLHSQLDSKLFSPLVSQLRSPLDRQLDSKLHSPLHRQLFRQLNKINNDWYLSLWWLSWCGYYDFTKMIGVDFDIDKFDLLIGFLKNIIFCVPYDGIFFMSKKPININWKNKLLHCENGPAIEFKDGYGLWALNGVTVTKEVVETPADKLDPKLILNEKNAEVRREIVRKIGIERIVKELKAKVINRWYDYELLELPIDGMSIKARYLKMINPSIGTIHIEGVPPDIETCEQALCWRVGGLKWEPEQLT